MYNLLDSGHFKKLEQIGEIRLIRPAPQAIWNPSLPEKEWAIADASYVRNQHGSGKWTFKNPKVPSEWNISFHELTLMIKLTNFGHLGIFAEHFFLSEWMTGNLKDCSPKPSVLNLFAYTGMVSMLLAKSGANVVHVDAAKGVNDWGKMNASLSKIKESIRWITDDVMKFVKKEINRGNRYDAIVLDPPSFGRGPKKELWKIEDHLPSLLEQLTTLFSPNFRFLALSAHTPGYTPIALQNLLQSTLPPGGRFTTGEMVIPHQSNVKKLLPSGAFCIWEQLESRIKN